jgi:terminal uridylyltransferase
MRASRMLSTRPDRAFYAIAQLCEERTEDLNSATSPATASMPPRLSPFPPQTPYTFGSSPMRLAKIDVLDPKSNSEMPSKPRPSEGTSPPGPSTTLPDHMAPKRSKWTSPPPPSASAEDRSQFENQLGLGLALATLPTDARQPNGGYASSSNNSEILTDDGDDLLSIQSPSLSEVLECEQDRRNDVSEPSPNCSPVHSSPQASSYNAPQDSPQSPEDNTVPSAAHIPPREPFTRSVFPNSLPGLRGRSPRHLDLISTSPRLNSPRRSHSGPPGPLSAGLNGKPFPPLTMAVLTPLPPSPSPPPLHSVQPCVYYESAPSPLIAYPVSPRYPPRFYAAAAAAAASAAARGRLAPSPTATPKAHSHFRVRHAHSHSMTTVHARTPSPSPRTFAPPTCGDSVQSNGSASPSPPDSGSAGSGSPAPSSLSSQCDAGVDLVRWEEGGENEGGTAADVEGAGTEEGWTIEQGKEPPDIISHLHGGQGEDGVPQSTQGVAASIVSLGE